MPAKNNKCCCDGVTGNCCPGVVLPTTLYVTLTCPNMAEWDGQVVTIEWDNANGYWYGIRNDVTCVWDPTCVDPGGVSTAEFWLQCQDDEAPIWILTGGIDSVSELVFSLISCDPFEMYSDDPPIFGSGCPQCGVPVPGTCFIEITE